MNLLYVYFCANPLREMLQKFILKNYLLGFFLLLITFSGFCQPNIVVSGRIIDKQSGLGIPYAHIYIQNTSIGTISNQEGYFKLSLWAENKNETIVFSSVGYNRVGLNLSSLNTTDLVVSLVESNLELKEVVVTPIDEARILVKQAISNINNNYPQKAHSFRGFYRSVVKLNNNPYYITEASLSINKESYSSRHKNGDVYINKGRYYKNDS